jgi:hypothetical protein
METLFAAAAIVSPIGIFIAVLCPAIAIVLARRPGLGPGRLVSGYLGALFALAILVAVTSYVSPQEAASVYKVTPEHYWSALAELFLSTLIVTAFGAILGISIVGLPTLLWLRAHGKGTAPWLILSSVIISLILSALFSVPMLLSSNSTVIGVIGIMLIPHMVCATGFAIAARLPWRLKVPIVGA